MLLRCVVDVLCVGRGGYDCTRKQGARGRTLEFTLMTGTTQLDRGIPAGGRTAPFGVMTAVNVPGLACVCLAWEFRASGYGNRPKRTRQDDINKKLLPSGGGIYFRFQRTCMRGTMFCLTSTSIEYLLTLTGTPALRNVQARTHQIPAGEIGVAHA